jgi:hypothetical protein
VNLSTSETKDVWQKHGIQLKRLFGDWQGLFVALLSDTGF